MTRPVVAERDRIETLARGLAAHYARAIKVQDRLDALDGRTGALASEELAADGDTANALARELVAELLRIAGDARLEPLLRATASGPAKVGALAAGLAASRLAIARRVSELASAGLAERDPNTDVVVATPLGQALVALVDDLADATAGEFRGVTR